MPRLLVPSLRTLIKKNQYSQREDASTVVPSPFSVPPWSPRRYLPLEPLIATRPCSRNSRKKSSGFSPSEHTRPLLEMYQNFPFTPAEGYQQILFLPGKLKHERDLLIYRDLESGAVNDFQNCSVKHELHNNMQVAGASSTFRDQIVQVTVFDHHQHLSYM